MPEQYVNVKKIHAQIMDAFETALEVIETENAVELPKRPKGRWEDDGIAMVCNQCHRCLVVEQGDADMNFCPHCGSDMREGDGENDT